MGGCSPTIDLCGRDARQWLFLDWSDTKPANVASTYSAAMRSNFRAFNASSGLNDACVAAHLEADQDAGDCYFAEHTADFIRTPMFAMQSVVEA